MYYFNNIAQKSVMTCSSVLKSNFFALILFLSFYKLSAQSPQMIRALSFQKNPATDSLTATPNRYKVFVVVELQDTVAFSQIECHLSTIDSIAPVYVSRQFSRRTPGMYMDGSSYIKDGNFLYLCLGNYVLNKPILVEAILSDTNDQRIGYLSAKE